MPRLDLGRLHFVDANDVEAEARLDHRAHDAGRQREHHAIELRHHLSATVPAEITARLLVGRIHALAPGNQLEVAATLNFDQQRIDFRARLGLRSGTRRRTDHDLPERHLRRALGERVAPLLIDREHIGLRHHSPHQLAVAFHLFDQLALHLLALRRLDERLAVFLRRSEAGAGERRAELCITLELVADLLQLRLDVRHHIAVRDFDFFQHRFLNQHLAVDQLIDDAFDQLAMFNRVGGHLHRALCATRVVLLEHLAPENRMLAGDRDHAIHRNHRRSGRGFCGAIGRHLRVQRNGAGQRCSENGKWSSHASGTRQARRRFITSR